MTLFPSMNMLMHQSIPTAPSPPPPTGICPPWRSRAWGFRLFCATRGRELADLGGTPRVFDTPVVYISKTWKIFVVKISALRRIGQQGLEKIVEAFKGMLSEF